MDDDFSQPAQPHPDRAPRVPLKAIQGIDQRAKCSIYYKDSRNAPAMPLIQNFSQEALTVFSDRARKALRDGAKVFIVSSIDKSALRDVLDWIMQCVAEEKAVFFQTYDEETPNLFTKYALAIEAAIYLGIPARDFSEGLMKRLVSIARKILMSWDEVEYFIKRYNHENPAPGVPDALFDEPAEGGDIATKLREVVAYSVFFGWWRGVLDEDETPDDMCFLDIFRRQQQELDAKLHEIAQQNEKDVRDRWEKKRLEREGRGAGFENTDGGVSGGTVGGWDNTDGGAVAATAGWDSDNTGAAATGDWDTAATGAAAPRWDSAPVLGDSDKENAAPSGASSSWNTPAATTSVTSWEDESEREGKEDWADEMNEAAAPSSGPAC